MNSVDLIIYSTLFISLYFEIFLLISFFEKKRVLSQKEKMAVKDLPTVTIIVPCWNEETTLAGTINSLLNLDYPKHKLNIAIVDDGSTDNTYKIAEKFNKFKNITLFQKENGGKHTAMNLVLENINTELTGCLDADSFVEANALKKLVRHFENKKIASVTPSIKISNTKTLLGKIQKSEYFMSIFIRKVFASLDSLFVTPGPFSFFRTSVIKDLGGWKKAHNTEDMEMGIRMQKNHYIIENEPAAIVYTKAPTTLKTLYRQRVRWTYGFLRNAWDHKDLFFNYKYGNLGIIILPTAVISLLTALFFLVITIFNVIIETLNYVTKILTVGINVSQPTIDLFYINTSSLSFIIYTLLILTLGMIIIGKKIGKEEKFLTIDIPLYISLYGFIAPLWITGATVKAIFRIDSKWR